MPVPVSPRSSELERLVDAAISGRISTGDWQTLSSLIASDEGACEFYATSMAIHAKLSRVYSMNFQVCPPFPTECLSASIAAEESVKAVHQTATRARISSHSAWLAPVSLALALSLVVGVALWTRPVPVNPALHNFHVSHSDGKKIGAFKIVAEHCDGVLVSSSFSDWMTINAGQTLTFPCQTTRVQYDSGVALTVTGPTKIEMHEQYCLLHEGKVVVTVSKGAEGFQVRTPQSSVTDYGTEFGVSVSRDGRSKVAVFEGEVGVDTKASGGERIITTGQGFQIDSSGMLNRLVLVDEGTFNYKAYATHRPLILAVEDNVRSDSLYNFYRIARNAFKEDARIYVDRVHEFNSPPGGELPSYLEDTELVMSFNDDKFDDSYEMTLAISRPADLFVLFDARLSPPVWLSSQFKRMPEVVGVDEETINDGPERLGKGPGVSVDNYFTVWKRRVDGGTVHLGHNGTSTTNIQLMYTVLAKDIE